MKHSMLWVLVCVLMSACVSGAEEPTAASTTAPVSSASDTTTGPPATTTTTTAAATASVPTTMEPATTITTETPATTTTRVPPATTAPPVTTTAPPVTITRVPVVTTDKQATVESMAADAQTAAASSQGFATTPSSEQPVAWPAPTPPPPPPTGPFHTVFYDGHEIGGFVPTSEQPFSTFGLDSDTASWYRQFAYLDQGWRPPPESVRTEEIVNVFARECATLDGRAVTVCADLSDHPRLGNGFGILRVVVDPRPVDPGGPRSYIVVLDKSGSMEMGDRWNTAMGTIKHLLDSLKSDDRFGLVMFDTTARAVIEPTDTNTARAVFSDLNAQPGGSTNAADGLTTGYRLAVGETTTGRSATVVFLSDGVANVGPAVGPASILELVETAKQDHDIALSAGGVGEANYNDVLLETIADRAQGWYQYLYDTASSERFVAKTLAGVIGWEAKTQVRFNPETVTAWRLLGYENRHIDPDDFRQDEQTRHRSAPLVGGVPTVALYETETHGSGIAATATVRWRPCPECEFEETSVAVTTAETAPFGNTTCGFRSQWHAARYAEFARNSPFTEGSTPEELLAVLDADTRCDHHVLRTVVERFAKAQPVDDPSSVLPEDEPSPSP